MASQKDGQLQIQNNYSCRFRIIMVLVDKINRSGDLVNELCRDGNVVNKAYRSGELIYQRIETVEHNYDEYFTLEALGEGILGYDFFEQEKTIYYSKNGSSWAVLPRNGVTVTTGDKIHLKGYNQVYGSSILSSTDYNVYGNIMSLVGGDNFQDVKHVANSAFSNLFSHYTQPGYGHKVVDASGLILPATTLANWCYASMFYLNRKLIAAPELPATTLTKSCYKNMFGGCTNLNYIKCLATDISASDCTYNWLDGVSSTGTFVKNASMSGWSTGVNGIPEGWTIINA